MNTIKINDRLDALEDIIKHQYETGVFRSEIGKLPDLERLLAMLYTY
jgi:DNA mismatch repair ATPase MutS